MSTILFRNSGGTVSNSRTDVPFYTIESAHEYMTLLADAIVEAKTDVEAQISGALPQASRYVDALRVALHNLHQLDHHIRVSRRVLNNLRTLRRLIYHERARSVTQSKAARVTASVRTTRASHDQSRVNAGPFPNAA